MRMSDKTAQILHISNLVPYSNHPFKLYEGERLDDMVRSIKELGVLQPVIVRPLNEDGTIYEILSGHNRVNAAKLAEFTEIPAIIKKDLSDEEAKLIVTETNLIQRSFADLSHSERAIALKTHMSAITKQGKRNDLINEITNILVAFESGDEETCGLIDHKTKSRDKTAVKYGIDPRSVSRYVRLSQLTPELLSRVDNGEIGLYPAVSISYLSPD
jgi:ParB family chromosome partitioning protein